MTLCATLYDFSCSCIISVGELKKGNVLIMHIKGIRDWSLITGSGGLQNGKIAGLKLFAPPPSR